jgi:hypothetical protein
MMPCMAPGDCDDACRIFHIVKPPVLPQQPRCCGGAWLLCYRVVRSRVCVSVCDKSNGSVTVCGAQLSERGTPAELKLDL